MTTMTINSPSQILRWLLLAALAVSAAAFAAAATDPSGVWTLKATGPNGASVESSLTLSWANNRLTGTIENRAGKADLQNAVFHDDQISFDVTRRIRLRKFVVHYVGKVAGDKLAGTLETKTRKQGEVLLPWEAVRKK
ncbi:MAG TPA: hypothetical protein VHE61_21640 [Opitutaceae bacterium]|nr:hypothetical protein [Opitutaceae bacterium]